MEADGTMDIETYKAMSKAYGEPVKLPESMLTPDSCNCGFCAAERIAQRKREIGF